MPLSPLANAIITFYFKFILFGAKKDNAYHKLGLSQGVCGVGKNQWRVTAYETTREKDKTFGDALFADKRPLSNPNKSNPTTKKQINRSKMMINFDLEQMRSILKRCCGIYGTKFKSKIKTFKTNSTKNLNSSAFKF